MTMPRRFHLQRNHDVTGASGTGRVADGVLWPDGTATLRWRGERASTVNWDRIGDAEAIHGHGGLETHRGDRHACPAPDCGPQWVRIAPNPDDDDWVHIHFPEIDYLDTQVWSADIGISTDALRELRDAIDKHLATKETAA